MERLDKVGGTSVEDVSLLFSFIPQKGILRFNETLSQYQTSKNYMREKTLAVVKVHRTIYSIKKLWHLCVTIWQNILDTDTKGLFLR